MTTTTVSLPNVGMNGWNNKMELPSIAKDPRAVRAYEGSISWVPGLSDGKEVGARSCDDQLFSEMHKGWRLHSPLHDYLQHGHSPRMHAPPSWLQGGVQGGDMKEGRTGEPGDSAKDWERDWNTHALHLPLYRYASGGGPRAGSKSPIGASTIDLNGCPECAAAAEEDDAMAEDWRRVHAPQVSGFHLLQHTITFDMRGTACEEELDARIRDDAIGEDSDADVERLKLDRCLTHETVPEHHRRRSILNVLQNLRRPASADGNNHVALECLDDDKNGVDLQPVTVSLEPAISAGRGRHAGAPTIVDRAERQLKRRASSITDRFKGYEPFRHHVQKPLAACEASNSSGDHGQRKATVSPVEHHD